MGRNPRINPCDLFELCFTLRISFLHCQLRRILGQTARINHHALRGINYRFVKIDFFNIIRISIIQLRQMVFGFLLNIQHPFFHQNDIIAGVGISATVQGMIGAIGYKGLSRQFPQSRLAELVFTVFIYRFAFPERK